MALVLHPASQTHDWQSFAAQAHGSERRSLTPHDHPERIRMPHAKFCADCKSAQNCGRAYLKKNTQTNRQTDIFDYYCTMLCTPTPTTSHFTHTMNTIIVVIYFQP